MRIASRNVALLVVLVALVGARFALQRPRLEVMPDGPLFPGLVAADVARVLVEGPGEPGRVELARDAADGWRVADRLGFPAHGWAVDELLGRVVALRTGERVATEASSHARYGVGGAGRRIVLTGSDGALLAAFVQGEPRERDGALATYVRPADGDAVYRSPHFPPVAVDPAKWIDSRLLAFEPADAAGLSATWRAGDGTRTVDLIRIEDGAWRDVASDRAGRARAVPAALVRDVLGVASGLYLARVEGKGVTPERGFGAPPEVALELDLGAGERARLWLGAPTEGGVWATNPGWDEPWVGVLPAQGAARLVGALEALAGDGEDD